MRDEKLFADACVRNRDPILDVLRDVLDDADLVLEVASGTGQHAAYFAAHLADLTWQPTDLGPTLSSIRAWRDEHEADNVLDPLTFDLFDEASPVDAADAVVCINAIHIAPWEATKRLFEHASKLLPPGGPLFLYGPFRYRDRPLEPSNVRFDEFLRRRDPDSGIRCFEDVDAVASALGFEHEGDVAMPANNHSIWWRAGSS